MLGEWLRGHDSLCSMIETAILEALVYGATPVPT